MQKTVLITGASRGIGAECARLFAQKGFAVAINYFKSEQSAVDLKKEILNNGGVAEIFCADVSDTTAVNVMVQKVVERFGNIDVLICNAGIAHNGLLIDLEEKDFDKIVGVNFKGVYNTTKSVLPYMFSCNNGSIVCISSVWGQTGGSCEVVYSATKSAVIGFCKALAKETALMGVRVNCIAPGVIETEMLNSLTQEDKDSLAEQTPLNRLGSPREVAVTALFLAGEDASFITGQVLGVNGGYYI